MNRLLHAQFREMYRVLDMMCLNLGRTIKSETIRIGDQIISQQITPEFSLHLQTQWRFVSGDRIILGSRDIYSPFSEDVGEDWDYSIKGRPDNESSIFDVVSKRVSKELSGCCITQCAVSSVGDIRISFSNGYIFEAFISASLKDEEWRLIDFTSDEHLIFCDVD